MLYHFVRINDISFMPCRDWMALDIPKNKYICIHGLGKSDLRQ